VVALLARSWCDDGVRLGAGAFVIVAESSEASAGVKEWTATRAAVKKSFPAIGKAEFEVIKMGMKSTGMYDREGLKKGRGRERPGTRCV